MQDEKIKIGIEEIQKIKMTLNEKENVFKSILNNSVPITKPIKSPYSFISIFRNPVFYYATVFCLIVILGGGGMFLNYFKNQNGKNMENLAVVQNEKQIEKNPQQNSNAQNPQIIAKNTVDSPKKTAKTPVGTSSLNTGFGAVSSALPTIQNNINKNEKRYQGNGFSFNYDASTKLTSGTIPNYGYYVEISTADKTNTIHFYSSVLPDNFRPEFFTGTMTINNKIFYFGDVQTENDIQRSYMYKKGGKTIVIQNDSLIDLNSIEIN